MVIAFVTLFPVIFFYAVSLDLALARDQAFDACQRNVVIQRDTLCIRTGEIGNWYFQPVSYGRRAESWGCYASISASRLGGFSGRD